MMDFPQILVNMVFEDTSGSIVLISKTVTGYVPFTEGAQSTQSPFLVPGRTCVVLMREPDEKM